MWQWCICPSQAAPLAQGGALDGWRAGWARPDEAWGQRAVQLLQCTASLPWGSGQWTFCNALPHCLGAVGSGTPAITGRTGLGGTGSPAQGVVGTSCKAHGEPSSSNNRAQGLGGTGSPAQGVVGASC